MFSLNNKGQTLIMFIVLIPLIFIMMALVIDISYLYREKTKLENVTEVIINDVYDKRNEDIDNMIKDLYKKNNISIKNLNVVVNNSEIIIKNDYEVESIFGKIIGLKKYKISVAMKGIRNSNNIKIIKE